MDGDEPPNSRNARHHRSRQQHLRNREKHSRGQKLGYLDDEGNLISPLHPEVYRSRVEEDEAISRALKDNLNSRYYELVKKNDGRDVEKELKEFIGNKLKEEVAQGMVLDDEDEEDENGDSSEGDEDEEGVEDAVGSNDLDKQKKATRKEKEVEDEFKNQEQSKTAAVDEKMKEFDDLAVFHYPRNATGYYRGLWVRTPVNKTQSDSKSAREDDIAKLIKHDTAKRIPSASEQKDGKEDQTINPTPRNVTVEEVHMWAQTRLQQRKDDVSLLFLPPNMFVEPDKPIAKNSTNATASSTTTTSQSSQKKSFTTSATSPSPINKPPSLSLTKDAGRAAFQLYSRPIPAMNELSVVDGLVKLYDGMTSSFVSRRTDVLLRVRGVMIHGVGKMSLVTSMTSNKYMPDSEQKEIMWKKRRSVLGIRHVEARAEDDFEDEEFHSVDEEEDENMDSEDEDETPASIDQRRRRLQAVVEQLISTSGKQESPSNSDESNTSSDGGIDKMMSQIRTEVMELYSSLFVNDESKIQDAMENRNEELKNSMEEEGWTLIQSLDEGGDDDWSGERSGEDDVNLGNDWSGGDDENSSSDIISDEPENPGDSIIRDEPTQRKLDGMEDDYLVTDNEGEVPEDDGFIERSGTSNVSMPLILGATMNGTDLAFRRSTLTLSATQERSAAPKRYVYPYPYVVDDAEDSIKSASSPATRRLPGREQLLEANAANCEFEINIDIQSTKWTFGEWRQSMEHRLRMGGVFNPYWNIAHSGKNGDIVKLKRSQYLSQLNFLEEQTPKEALVMTMIGDIESKNCNFHSFVNVTAMRTNWEHTTAKAINYSFYMMLTCLTQIVILLRQLLHTQSQSVASNVSLLCIGWQTVLDAILCIGHIFLCLVMQPLFTAFASVAFFKLLIFCVIEMKYMAIIIQARNNANNTGLTQEDMRRQITLLHLKFYGALMSAILAFWYLGQSNRTLYVLLLYSFWVPQIILNIITESRKPMHPYYMYGMSLTRSVAPIYVFAVRNNFLKEVNPDFPTEPKMCQLLILWIAIQTAILFAQSKYGTRFMIPKR